LAGCVGDLLSVSIPKIGTINDVMITGYANRHTSGDATFTIDLKTMQIATAESIVIPAPVPSAEPTMADPRDAGVQSTEQGTDTEAERSRLADIVGV